MSDWVRTNRKRKCPICDHADWCGISKDGMVAVCMRVESEHATDNGGWLHRLSDPIPVYNPPPRRIEPAPDLSGLWRRWEKETDYHLLDGLGMSLGVDSEALRAIGCAWNGKDWAFKMKNAQKEMIGIRLRSNDGRKFAVTGSRSGLFIPEDYPYGVDDGTIYLCEGPSDAAAALTLGLPAIGRPSCLGQEQMILDYLQRTKVRRLVVITDNDDAGLGGARKLQSMLKIRSCLYCPPCKDLRAFVNLGGDAQLIESSIADLVWKAA